MPRPKKPTYEWVPALKRYRKRIKDADGQYVPIYGKTEAELTAKLEDARRQIEAAEFRREHPTVKDYAENWLALREPYLRATTMRDYRIKVRIYLVEPLGHLLMAEVTPDLVKTALCKAAARSESIYHTVKMLFKMIFGAAFDNGTISKDPCAKLDPKGGKAPKGKTALTNDQATTLLAAVSGSSTAYPFVMLGLFAGLRREEILALKWDSVDLDGAPPTLTVRRAWHIEHNRPIILDELKTPSAHRTIPLPPQLAECLKAVKARSASEYVISAQGGGPLSGSQFRNLWDYINVRSTKERHYYRYINGQKVLHTITPKLGERDPHNKAVVYTIDFQVSPHILRHTYVTNLLLGGVDIKTVQYLAGHKHAKITLDIYAHLTYNQPVDIAQKVNAAFGVKSEVKAFPIQVPALENTGPIEPVE